MALRPQAIVRLSSDATQLHHGDVFNCQGFHATLIGQAASTFSPPVTSDHTLVTSDRERIIRNYDWAVGAHLTGSRLRAAIRPCVKQAL